jgi:hypothetical protein
MNMLKRESDQALRSYSEFRPTGLCVGTLLLCGILMGGAPVLAQSMGRTLTGTVTDRHHEPLSGAIVQVHSETTLSVVSYITDRGGQYVFKHLSPDDDYNVFATYRGYRSKARRLSKFDSKADRTFRLVIKLP